MIKLGIWRGALAGRLVGLLAGLVVCVGFVLVVLLACGRRLSYSWPALVSLFPTLAHAGLVRAHPHAHPRTRSRAHARHAHAPTHAVGRVGRLHRRNPHTRGTYIVVTHSHTRRCRVRVRKDFGKSAGQRGDIVAPRSKPTPRKNPYPYSYVVRIFFYPKGNSMDAQARLEKVLEQYKKGLLTTQETQTEVTMILVSDFLTGTQS